MGNKQIQAMRLLQNALVGSLTATAKAQVSKLQRYVQIRNWQYTTMSGLKAMADMRGDNATTRLLIDADGKVIGMG
jgi:hypothetical protein